MYKKLQHYKSVFNDLELNKTTEDVAVDLHHLQVGVKIRYYAYYTVVTLASVTIFFSALHYIKSDNFRDRLINEAGVSPVSSLIYSDYREEQNVSRTRLHEISYELREIDSLKSGTFTYGSRQFRAEVKSGKLDAYIDEIVKGSEAEKKFLQIYFLSYLIGRKDDTVMINGNEYTFADIADKVKDLSREEAMMRLQKPAETILETAGLDAALRDNLTDALLILPQLDSRSSKFYAALDMPTPPEPDKMIKSALAEGKSDLELRSRTGYRQTIALPSLDELEKKRYQAEKAVFDTKAQDIAAKKKELEDKRIKLEKEAEAQQRVITAIDVLNQDIAYYKKNELLVEDALDKLDEVKGD